MKKLLALIGLTSLVLNSSVTGVFLLSNTIESNKIKIGVNNTSLNQSSDLKVLNDLVNLKNGKYMSPIEIIDIILPLINNTTLSDDATVKIFEDFLKKAKDNVPEIEQYLSYFKYGSMVASLTNELANDWDQQADHGSNTLSAMRNYINSGKGDIAQAKNAGSKGQWHYVDVRAGNWNWNDFYQYMAGANMNYMIKVLANGNYIGDLIDNHLHLGPWNWGFDKDDFLNDMSRAMQNLTTTERAWPYLMKTIVPLAKTKILKTNNPTLGFENLTWEATNNKDLSLKTLLKEVEHLLSPAGHKDLVNIFASLLSGPFGEDIIIDCGALGYYTFTELLEVLNSWPISAIIGDGLKPEVLAEAIVNGLTSATDKLGIVGIISDFIKKAETGVSENVLGNLPDLAIDLNKFYDNGLFNVGLDALIDLIIHPETTRVALSDVFMLWGTRKDEDDFALDSPLAIMKKWIDDPKSILHSILNILRKIS